MAITTPDAVPGEVIEAAWGDAVRADLVTLDQTKVNVAGDVMTGPLALPAGDPVAASHAARKSYVDSQVSNKLTQAQVDARVTAVGDPLYVNVAGDLMTAALNIGGDPTVNSPATLLGLGRIHMSYNGAAPILQLKAISPAGTYHVGFYWGGTLIGSITRNGTDNGVLYNTSSHGPYKGEVADVDADAALAAVRTWRPVNYRWKIRDGQLSETGEPSGPVDNGFIAQDLADAAPYAVTPGVGVEGDEGFMPWGVDLSRLVPNLVAAVQALAARVDDLTARLAAT